MENAEGARAFIGKYSVLRLLGKGGEGRVYLARDEDLQRLVAIKEICRGAQDPAREKELMREADVLQRLRHPMLPVVYDLLWEEGWYLVMEYVQGMTLGRYIAQNGCVQEEQARDWAAQLLDILHYLHTRKTPVIYRDLKPDNILVCQDGRLKLIDFGAACRRTFGGRQEHGMAATPGYAAPEQLGRRGQPPEYRREWGAEAAAPCREAYADERSDIYAFGRVLYYSVTGADPSRPPYTSLSIRDYQPMLSDGLERVIRKCMEEEPDRRYRTASEAARELERSAGRRSRLRRRSFIKVIEKQVWLTEGEQERTQQTAMRPF